MLYGVCGEPPWEAPRVCGAVCNSNHGQTRVQGPSQKCEVLLSLSPALSQGFHIITSMQSGQINKSRGLKSAGGCWIPEHRNRLGGGNRNSCELLVFCQTLLDTQQIWGGITIDMMINLHLQHTHTHSQSTTGLLSAVCGLAEQNRVAPRARRAVCHRARTWSLREDKASN